ncbi:MAG TPA: SagB/ThcOx family dehydrogenase [Halobacteria archaeon]|jgi:SagB-type dehydrogenase family enzyme|nr:SagB/ThcOx family dehydrogenase [Halobacteria archaeon]HIH78001.1 SagB/ThcOx family dehydrogenase [Halobacteria archaeon]
MNKKYTNLPSPETSGDKSVEETIKRRRSERTFISRPLSSKQLSQILWAAQGITYRDKRAAPSAGATYPIDLYVVIGSSSVTEIDTGLYHYIPEGHRIEFLKDLEEDLIYQLVEASLFQMFIADAPISIVITGEYERMTIVYGRRGIRYVLLEAGHVSQNIYLQVTSLGLGTVAIGAFHDHEVSNLFGLPQNQRPLYLMPIGYVR